MATNKKRETYRELVAKVRAALAALIEKQRAEARR